MNEKQLHDKIMENIGEEFFTIQELEQSEFYNENDFTVFYDVNLSALIDDLIYNGISPDDIWKRVNAQYGNVIDFYYLANDKVYVMCYGVR